MIRKVMIEETRDAIRRVTAGEGRTVLREVDAREPTFEASLETEIGRRAREAGEVAGIRALHRGASKTAARDAGDAELARVAAKLRASVDAGEPLPGGVRDAMLRLETIADRGPPPPITVTNSAG